MSDTSEETGSGRAATPWYLWVVGVIALLWNAMGAVDYVMTQTRNEEYLAAFTEEQLEYFFSFPTWVNACWAIAVWSAFAGSVLLLARSRFAFHAFVLSIVGMAGTTTYTYLISDATGVYTVQNHVFMGAIVVVTLALTEFARRMARRSILT